jgi:two-component system capsular synthesis response regulator RcsB
MRKLAPPVIKIALMDRYPLTLCGLANFIASQRMPTEIIAKETNMQTLSERLIYQSVDILITDINGQNETPDAGLRSLLNISKQHPNLRIIVYTACKESDYLCMLLTYENISVIGRNDNLQQVGEYFSRVYRGERVLSPLIGSYLVRSKNNIAQNNHQLTRCENDVLRFLSNGASLYQIAELQGKSIKTISAHKCNAMRKLHVKTNSELFSLLKNDSGNLARN